MGSNPATPTTSIRYLDFLLEDTPFSRYYHFLPLLPDNEISSLYTHSVKSTDDINGLGIVKFCRYTLMRLRRNHNNPLFIPLRRGDEVRRT